MIRECINRYDRREHSKLDFLCADQLKTNDERDGKAEYYDNDEPQQATNESVDSTSNNTCVVCLNAHRQNIALVPCGHSIMCGQCAQTIVSNGQHCPLCRSPVAQLLNIYH